SDKMVHAMFLEGDAAVDAVEQLTPRLQAGERIAVIGRELWIDYGSGGAASTRLTGPVLDRALRTAGTARNINTVRRLVELTAPAPSRHGAARRRGVRRAVRGAAPRRSPRSPSRRRRADRRAYGWTPGLRRRRPPGRPRSPPHCAGRSRDSDSSSACDRPRLQP